jgi:predicted metalloprotease with PDZ domain
MKSLFLATAAAAALAAPALAQFAPPPQPAPMPPPIEAPRDVAYPGVLRLEVDATDLDRRIFRVRETIPVAGGPTTLLFPQWSPEGHSPRNPIWSLDGLVVRADGQPLAWRRDPVDVYAFHLSPPAGARTLEVEFQILSPTAPELGRVVMTPEMLNAEWMNLALYPAGYFLRGIPVEAQVRLPDGWGYATALETAGREPGLVRFKPVAFDVLADSPLIAGRYFKAYELDTSGRSRVTLDVVADSPEFLSATPEAIEKHRELIRQADKLYGSRHYDHYDFLLSLSDRMGTAGFEHHRSSEDGTRPDYFTAWARNAPARNILPHEYSHSWDGKFRRPADLWTPNLNVPMRGSLLWVYEGQDQYWGYVLGARSGLVTRQQTLDALAMTAAAYSAGRPGRQWRSVEDTTNDPIIANRRALPWPSWQRSEDYYSEGQLVWLDADTLIRERTGGKKSLDDFARAFFGVEDGNFSELTYSFDDVVAGLNAVMAYDWAKFLDDRFDKVRPEPPLDGLTRGGYRLVFAETPTEFWRENDANRKQLDLTYSIGLTLNREGVVTTVLWDGPAFKAGITLGAHLVAVNGVAYDADLLKEAITAAKSGPPVSFIVRAGDRYRVVALDYHGGLRYPRLERLEGKPDLLSAIYAPR